MPEFLEQDVNDERKDGGLFAGGVPWPATPGLMSLMPVWSGWLAWWSEWQRTWMGAMGAWPGLNGVRPTLPLLWDPGFLMPRVDARITPVVSDAGNEAARVSMTLRMPRYGCLGPADLVAVEAFVARRPDPAVLGETVHPVQAVAPLPAPGIAPVPKARSTPGRLPAVASLAATTRPSAAPAVGVEVPVPRVKRPAAKPAATSATKPANGVAAQLASAPDKTAAKKPVKKPVKHPAGTPAAPAAKAVRPKGR